MNEERAQGADVGRYARFQELIPCPHCKDRMRLEHAHFVAYFETGSAPCPKCGKQVDWWSELLSDFAGAHVEWQVAALVGAELTAATFELAQNEEKQLDLDQLSIPASAEILSVLTEVEVSGEPPHVHPAVVIDPQIRLDQVSRKMWFFGSALGQSTSFSRLTVCLMWIAPGHDDISVHHLVDAGKQLAAGRFRGVIVPANVAVEAVLTPAIRTWIRVFCSREDTDGFVGPRGATYAHHLKVLSKIAAKDLGIATLPAHVLALLNSLRNYRNDLVHTGKLRDSHPDPDKKKATEFLAAAVFGYHYAMYLNAAAAGRPSLPSGGGAG